MGLYQTKKLLHMKEIINKIKRQPIEWEKIFAHAISDKILIFKIYKILTELNIKKIKQSDLKMSKGILIFRGRHTDGQQTHEKMFNIINH